jgi:succinyl-CoA synthetase beta subunit
MDLLRKNNVPVPKGGHATTIQEALDVHKRIIGDGNDCVVKAMVFAGTSSLNNTFLVITHY